MLFPLRCIHCGRFDIYLCRTCEPFLFTPGNIAQPRPLIRKLFWVGSYKNPFLQQLIHDGKYSGIPSAFTSACRILFSVIRRANYDFIIPIPLHRRRLRERGFNQAEIIARFLSQDLHIPFAHDYLIRTRYTRQQVKLSYEQRQQNVADAFLLVQPLPAAVRSILLVDDVWTTGATMHAAAQALRQNKKFALTAAVIAKD